VASSRKKVVVRRFSTGPLWGYLPQSGFVVAGSIPMLDLLDLSGRVQPLPLSDVKYVSFVRDFNMGDQTLPERLVRKTFLARPRSEGVWVRLQMRDNDRIEGLAPLDVAFADSWTEDLGVHLIPPDIRGNTQRLFVPRSAMDAMEVVAVITTPSRKKSATPQQETQADLFSLPLPPDTRTQ
jgi:hypothetical protein